MPRRSSVARLRGMRARCTRSHVLSVRAESPSRAAAAGSSRPRSLSAPAESPRRLRSQRVRDSLAIRMTRRELIQIHLVVTLCIDMHIFRVLKHTFVGEKWIVLLQEDEDDHLNSKVIFVDFI